jgi:hypothetical protein
VNDQSHAPAALHTTKELRYTLDRDRVSPRFDLDVAQEETSNCPIGESNSVSSVVQFVTQSVSLNNTRSHVHVT